MKAVLREMFISISAYVKNKIRSQTNSLMMYFRTLDKQKQAKHKSNRCKKKTKQKKLN